MTGDMQKTAAQDLSSDPAETWREVMGMSTSDQLARARAEVTALTRELLESREETLAAVREVEGVREELTRQASTAGDLALTLGIRSRALAASQADLTRVEQQRDEAYVKLDDLNYRLDFASAYRSDAIVVAEQDCGLCAECGALIVRSQAVKALPDTTTKPAWSHAVCPEEKS